MLKGLKNWLARLWRKPKEEESISSQFVLPDCIASPEVLEQPVKKSTEIGGEIPKPVPEEPAMLVGMRKNPHSHEITLERGAYSGRDASNFTTTADVLTAEEIDTYIRANPLWGADRHSAEPPATLSFQDRALYLEVMRSLSDDQKAKLFASGGMDLLRETVLDIVDKYKRGESEPVPKEEKQDAKPVEKSAEVVGTPCSVCAAPQGCQGDPRGNQCPTQGPKRDRE